MLIFMKIFPYFIFEIPDEFNIYFQPALFRQVLKILSFHSKKRLRKITEPGSIKEFKAFLNDRTLCGQEKRPLNNKQPCFNVQKMEMIT